MLHLHYIYICVTFDSNNLPCSNALPLLTITMWSVWRKSKHVCIFIALIHYLNSVRVLALLNVLLQLCRLFIDTYDSTVSVFKQRLYPNLRLWSFSPSRRMRRWSQVTLHCCHAVRAMTTGNQMPIIGGETRFCWIPGVKLHPGIAGVLKWIGSCIYCEMRVFNQCLILLLRARTRTWIKFVCTQASSASPDTFADRTIVIELNAMIAHPFHAAATMVWHVRVISIANKQVKLSN